MKCIAGTFFALLAATTSVNANEAWKEEALSEILTLERVLDAGWSEAGTLWLFANPDQINWDFVTDTIICSQLIFAGKPEGEEVLVSWFSHTEALQGNRERIANAVCK